MRSAELSAALTRTLSRDRLSKYLAASGDDIHQALIHYERNTALSESFYTPLQAVEVCVRNCMNAQLCRQYGDQWFIDPRIPLDPDGLLRLADARKALEKGRYVITQGAMVAELSFGFWVSLLGPRYDATLWRNALYRAFAEGGRGIRRDRVHGRFNMIRRFRNRIAHHEPIFLQDLPGRHREIVEAISWMCPFTATWALSQSRFETVYAAK